MKSDSMLVFPTKHKENALTTMHNKCSGIKANLVQRQLFVTLLV